ALGIGWPRNAPDRTLSVWLRYTAASNAGKEGRMVSIHVDIERMEWTPGSAKYGSAAIYDGREILQSKILSDRRQQGRGLALLSKVSPPPGKLVKIIAIARSDEHVFNLEGGCSTKSGQPTRSASDYTLNSEGQLHSALIASETL